MHSFTKKSTCFLMTAIAAAIVTSPITALATPPQTNSTGWSQVITPASDTTGAISLGKASDSDVVHIAVMLKLQNKDQLVQFVKDQSASANPQWLSSADSAKAYAPTQDQVKAVTDYLTGAGFTNVKTTGGLVVTANGTAPIAQKAFNTTLGKYSINGKIGILNTQGVQIPAALNDSVGNVIGLNTIRRPHGSMSSRISKLLLQALSPTSTAGTTASTGYYPDEMANVYHAGKAPTGAQTDVAIIGFCSMTNSQNDVLQMIKDRGLPSVTTSIVEVTPPNCDSISNAMGEGEFSMDAQAIVGISGGVKSLTFYTGPGDDAGILQTIAGAISANKAKILNMSFGEPETQAGSKSYDDLFLIGKSQGQLFVAASGDNGAYPCASDGSSATTCNGMGELGNGSAGDPKKPWVSMPANSPYVIAVGGTTLKTNWWDKSYSSETAWPSSGGGISQFEPMPDWQKGVVNGNFRAIPDVAFDADTNSPLTYYMTTNIQTNLFFNLIAFLSDPNVQKLVPEIVAQIKNGGSPISVINNLSTAQILSLIQVGTMSNGQFTPDPGQIASSPIQFVRNFNGYTSTGGGTSLSAPLFVGTWARAQSKAGGKLPFAPEIIYGLAKYAGGKQGTAMNAPGVHDVISGNNGSGNGTDGYTAGKGWDNVTGWGSPDIEALINIDPKLVLPYINKSN